MSDAEQPVYFVGSVDFVGMSHFATEEERDQFLAGHPGAFTIDTDKVDPDVVRAARRFHELGGL